MIWKPIKEYEGVYEISDDGQVRSIRSGKFKKFRVDRDGYLLTDLWKNNKPYCAKIHRLVALAFIPTNDTTLHVNHKDGIKSNNTITNLEWVTPAQNSQHAWDTGLMRIPHSAGKGIANPSARLNEDIIKEIRSLYSVGNLSQQDIGNLFGISQRHVSLIVRRVRWSHVL